MFDLFGCGWEELDLPDVAHFLAAADEEGVTWEAKADDERGPLRPDSIRKAACGLANQIGGYLILGAKQEKKGAPWELPGIDARAPEMKLWVGQVLRELRPVPRFDVRSWSPEEAKVVMVVKVEPIAEPPCMTSQGRVYERVSGQTIPVEDPTRLQGLFSRGADARALAAARAPAAALRAMDASGWKFQRSVAIGVGLSSHARETDDISSRLFRAETRQVILDATWSMMKELRPQGRPDDVSPRQEQDSHRASIDFVERTNWGTGNEVLSTTRSTWLTQGHWDGSVGASLTLSDGDVEVAPPLEELVRVLWDAVVPIGDLLGGYGPSQLAVVIAVMKSSESVVEGTVAHAPGRPPARNTLFAAMPAQIEIRRLVDPGAPTAPIVASICREARRSAGEVQDEGER